eukprot:TRINITY_DN4324_c0_g2_i1.p1 TRINITY_DN4324_c0_g2~~TRINITY_DN4324_c0_g2_i1.p1  ORF type:complete len:1002 (-),score=247.35 TRINITY_DN4324_c0_g2_i1:43-3048(-)
MRAQFSFGILILLITLATSSAVPKNLQQLQQAIQNANGKIGATIVGQPMSQAFSKAFGNTTLNLGALKFSTVGNTLKIHVGQGSVWNHIEIVDGFLHFWFDGTVLQAEIGLNTTVAKVGNFGKVWGFYAAGNSPDGVNFSGGHSQVMFGLSYVHQKDVYFSADVNFKTGSVFDEASRAIVKGYSAASLGVFRFALMQDLALGSGQFDWHIPGNYSLGHGIIIENIELAASLEPEVSIQIDCDVFFTKLQHGPQSLHATAAWSHGSPLVLTTTLNNPWVAPLGVHWLTVTTGTIIITVGEEQHSIKLDGSGVLDWAKSDTVTVSALFGGDSYTDVMISVTNLPVFGFNDAYKSLSGKSSKALIGINTKSQGILSFSISNFDGSVPKGLTIEGVATVEKGGDIYHARHIIDKDGITSVYDLNFFSPIFDDPAHITLDLTISNPWIVNQGLSVTNFAFHVQINTETTITITGDFSWLPKNNPNYVTFEATGTFTSGADTVALNADLTSVWPDAFGRKYLSIQTGSFSLNFSPTSVALSLSGQALFDFGDSKDNVQFSLDASDNFQDITFSCQFTEKWSVSDIVAKIAGIPIKKLSDFDNTVHVGFTLQTGGAASIAITSSGTLVKTSETYKMLSKISDQVGTITWQLAVNLPLSVVNAENWSVSLTFADEIKLRKNLWFENTQLSIDHQSFTLAAEFKAQLKNNPDLLTFKVSGDIGPTQYGFKGEMDGTWTDVFGVRGFDLADVLAQVEFSPAACSDGTCISQFDLGFTTELGLSKIIFAGGVGYPALENSFLIGEYTREIEISDLCMQWNKMVPHKTIKMDTVPKHWVLSPTKHEDKVMVTIAAEAGSFGPYTYEQGFRIIFDLEIIGLHIDIDVGCSFSDYTPDCSFHWDVHMDREKVQNAINQELALMDMRRMEAGLPAPEIKWNLNEVSLTEWSADNLANGINPKWHFDFTIHIFGHHKKTLSFKTPLTILHGDFKQFFKQYIKHVFDDARETLLAGEY